MPAAQFLRLVKTGKLPRENKTIARSGWVDDGGLHWEALRPTKSTDLS